VLHLLYSYISIGMNIRPYGPVPGFLGSAQQLSGRVEDMRSEVGSECERKQNGRIPPVVSVPDLSDKTFSRSGVLSRKVWVFTLNFALIGRGFYYFL
jgi:hypothetical protein